MLSFLTGVWCQSSRTSLLRERSFNGFKILDPFRDTRPDNSLNDKDPLTFSVGLNFEFLSLSLRLIKFKFLFDEGVFFN